MNLNHCNIHHKGEITNWDEALPLGNGKLGVLLYGSNPLRLSLDRMDLWDNRPAPATLEEGFHFSHMKQLIDSGSDKDWREFLRMFDHIYTATAFPSKITAGRLELTFADPFTPEYTLSLDNAAAVVTDQNGSLRLTGFTSAEDFIGVFRVYGDYSMSVHIPKYISDHDAAGPGTSMGYPPTQIVQENGFTYTRQETHTDFTYGIVVYEKNCGSCRELYFTITASTDGENDLDDAKASLLRAADTGYEALLEKHTAWWQSYWAKSEINIGDPMVEPVYYRSMYLFGSCSRKGFYPMPLQGVWTADNDALPPWKGDYHHDTNTQLSYQAYLKANHLPEGEVFLDYLWNLRDAYRKYARDFFSVDGLLIPGVSTMDGKPMGGWPQYTYSPAMTIWTIQSFDEYYLYTDDIEFLKNRAYPMFTEVGTAIEGLLEERGGKLYLPLSSSPEIYDNQRKAYLKPNSNFDLALMRYLFTTLAGYAKILNDDNAAAHWNRILSKLDDIALNGSSILLAEGEPLHVSHRHLSHLMCLYPLHLINYDTPEHMAIYQRALHDLE
ncbi:MAG: glycoside hydrolase N-terminal domain-containing protein, partial [Clostridia bacterium]|nr:glycoside hydrolase N-terminal domain-containing protein [Clostridia bacterium]